jgi:hypothetical protein
VSARDRSSTSRPGSWLLAGLAAFGISCGTPDRSGAVSTIELARTLDGAELQPSAAAFSRTLVVLAGRDAVAVVAPAASRVTWPLRLPPHAHFAAQVAAIRNCADDTASVRVSVGISDDRTYEELWRAVVPASDPAAPRWTPISVDLGNYGGRKLSLFYRPDRITWRLIANARPAPPAGCVAHVLWGAPRVEAR